MRTAIALISMAALTSGGVAVAQEARVNGPSYGAEGAVYRPANWREWVYVGTPLTPNELNDGEAAFPEFHNVYVEPSAWEHYKSTGEWADGTQIVKELVLIRDNDNDSENGSTQEVSGRGYMMGEFAGLELETKDSARYPEEPGNWAYFSFGHQPEPYAATATAFPTASCNTCHETSAAEDFVFTQFYPVIRAAKPTAE